MASDETHARNRKLMAMLVASFFVGVTGIALEITWLTWLGVGAFGVALLGRYWS